MTFTHVGNIIRTIFPRPEPNYQADIGDKYRHVDTCIYCHVHFKCDDSHLPFQWVKGKQNTTVLITRKEIHCHSHLFSVNF